MSVPYLSGLVLSLSVAAALAGDSGTWEQRRQMEQALDLKIRQSLYRQRVQDDPPPRLEERLRRQRLEQQRPAAPPAADTARSPLERALDRQRMQMEEDGRQLRWEMERRTWR